MGRRWLRLGVVSAVLVGVLVPLAGPASSAAEAKIQRGLLARLDSGKLTRFVVEFRDSADLVAAARTRGWGARGAAVYRALTVTAARSQARAIGLVRATPGARASSHWLSNEMFVEGDAHLARRLAALPEVSKVRAELVFPLVEPVDLATVTVGVDKPPPWGITKIGADKAWADGILGSGVVVANVDTGVDFEHEALVNQYRGNLGGGLFDHNYNWWDPTGVCGDTPCDNVGHGTHTMGTMVGGDGPGPFTPDIGVAPGAQWMAAKGCEEFFCTEGSLVSAGEFVLAPTDLNGDNPDPSMRPDIVNNSWGGEPGNTFYLDVVQAWRAAGIVPVFSSGNPGSGCGDGGSPGDYLESFSAGATDANDQIADFSGRGPSSFGKVNPDVAAPGVGVLSSVPGDDYIKASGTSMAAPHTAGTLALVLSAEPALAGQIDFLTDAVRSTAFDILDDSCGGDPDGDPNNVYGDGRIDAFAAASLVATGGTLAGDVSDVTNGDPVAGATVEASRNGKTYRAVSDPAGHFELFLAAGTYTVVTSAFGFQDGLATGVTIQTDLTTDQDFFLAPLPRRDIVGTVTVEETGAPIEGAEVTAVGTPVPPARTAADGTYTLTLPIGDFTIRTSAGGCTAPDEDAVTLTVAGLTRDVALARKLDEASHGCRPIAFDWVNATIDSPMFGNETVGRFTLPFSFPYYGQSYDRVFVTDNGYLTFEAPPDALPAPIPGEFPSEDDPNAAIYAMWQNLEIDDASVVRTDTVTDGSDQAFVVEFEQLKVGPRSTLGTAALGGDDRVDFEVKLWDDGRIDLLYGDNPADPGDGRNAAIGIESPGGTDGLAFSVFDDLLSANVAYRYKVVPSGVVHGTVTDANDGLPVAGATVTANGVRSATTAADGTYSLRLYPGTYALATTKPDYADHVDAGVSIVDGADDTLDVSLDAPVADIAPASIDKSVAYGSQATPPLTIDNPGAVDLTWELFERDDGVVLPDLPPVPALVRDAAWGPALVPPGVREAHVHALPPDALETIIDDPDDDSLGSIEITQVRAGSDASDMSMAIDFTDASTMDQIGGYVMFDVDQKKKTGYPPRYLAGLPSQDIGFEYFADLFSSHDSDPIVNIWDRHFNLIATVPAVYEGQTLSYTVPLTALGNDDGNIDTVMVIGDFQRPLDWAPDEGHGTIRAFVDAPWLTPSASSGVVPAGQSDAIDLTLGDDALPPGDYRASLVIRSDAPRRPAVTVDVHLEVRRPASWGAISGVVRDAHRGFWLEDAKLILHARWQGAPLDLRARTDERGAWRVQGPEGVWRAELHRDGYVPVSMKVEIARDVTTEGNNVRMHAAVPHATLPAGAIDLTLLHGQGATIVRTLGNVEGHRPLEFHVGEVLVPPGTDIGDGGGGGGSPDEPPPSGALPEGTREDAHTSRSLGIASPVPDATLLQAKGDFLDSWPTDMSGPWGVGYRSPGVVSITDVEDLIEAEFTTKGQRTNEFDLPWVGSWAADLAWDAGRKLMWHVNVGGDNGIYGVDPTDGSVSHIVTGDPWDDISQRGLAYDGATDTFYIGGWNEGRIYHVAGPSWPTPGLTLGSCRPDDRNISGLAWNPAFQKLWVATNSRRDTIWRVDPDNCRSEAALKHPDPRYHGAGLEMDAAGNLWTVSQRSKKAYLLESGLPTFSDVPWLTVRPGRDQIMQGHHSDLEIRIDTESVPPGLHRAFVVVTTNDPDRGAITIPIRLNVTKYRRFVNVGGEAVIFGDGTSYVADRRFTDGGFGYVGDSLSWNVDHAIADTRYQSIFRSQRYGMRGYRFSVPDGRYEVTLEFAELTAGVGEFGRIMDIYAQGDLVLNNLDVAARVGRNHALTRTFHVQVRNGMLRLEFDRAHGKPPMLNGVRVTWLPGGASS